MDNSPWHDIKDEPLPEGESVLVYLSEEYHGGFYAIHTSMKIANGYMEVIGGHFDFDFPMETVLCWRRLEDIEAEIPLRITEGTDEKR